MPEQLILVVGPIACGKSTISQALAGRFRRAGHRVAVLDLDDLVATVGGFVGLEPEEWVRAQVVFGRLIAAWLTEGYTVVAHGPVFQPAEDARVVDGVPDGVPVRRVHLTCTFPVAALRVESDHARAEAALSKGHEFLRLTYDRFAELAGEMVPSDLTLDSTTATAEELTDLLADAFLNLP